MTTLSDRSVETASWIGRSALQGWWVPGAEPPVQDPGAIWDSIRNIGSTLYFLRSDGDGPDSLGRGGSLVFGSDAPPAEARKLAALAPAILPQTLGDESFRRDYGVRHAYVTGSMANGIASEAIVEAAGRGGMLGMFGAGGCTIPRVSAAIDRISSSLKDLPYGFNLIHTPGEPRIEEGIVDLYLQRQVHLVEASAYLDLTLPLVRYRTSGIHRDAGGLIVTPNRVMAKVSRVEVAAKFFAPPPERLLAELVAAGVLTQDQAKLASQIPMAQDVTAEADSGGHTDNRPAICLFPTILAVRDRMQAQYGFAQRLRVGVAGGIATPASAAAAFAMGAAYIMTGSVNQACVESGSSEPVRRMLAEAGQADTTMAPAADMFELGVKLQVLKRGTMFPMRAARLYEVYRAYDSLDAIPATERANLEKTIFRAPLAEIWQHTQQFFRERDPGQLDKAEKDPRHKMALVFRWYLGLSSHWANQGNADRKLDYQVWCGPAMGAFNEWCKGSALEQQSQRTIVEVAQQLLYGAAVALRVAGLRAQGARLPEHLMSFAPVASAELRHWF